MNCPSFERLIDYFDGRLDKGETERVSAHLASGCKSCAGDRDWYLAVKEAAGRDDSTEPPPWVLKRAFRIFEEKSSRPRLVERLGRAVASLVFDSFANPSIQGVRSTETMNRQLLYRAGDYSLDLQISPSSESRSEVLGQVLREGESHFESVVGLKVELLREGAAWQETATDGMGEFAFYDVESGVYDLRLETSDASIIVQGLSIASPL